MSNTLFLISGFLVLGVVVAMVYYKIKTKQIEADLAKLNAIDPELRGELLPVLEGKYNFRSHDLTRDQRYELIKTELTQRTEQRKRTFSITFKFSITFIVVGFIANFFFLQPGYRLNDLASSQTDSLQSLDDHYDPDKVPYDTMSLVFVSRLADVVDTLQIASRTPVYELLFTVLNKYEILKLAERQIPWADSISFFLISPKFKPQLESTITIGEGKHFIQPSWQSVYQQDWRNGDTLYLGYWVKYDSSKLYVDDHEHEYLHAFDWFSQHDKIPEVKGKRVSMVWQTHSSTYSLREILEAQ